MEASPIDKAWHVFYGLMRNHPLGPSTFSTCDCRRSMARGAGKCHLCLREELAEHVGPVLAQRADAALAEVVEAWALIREEAGRRANDQAKGPATAARSADGDGPA